MIKFIVDTQLPPKLSKYLLTQEFNSKHTTDFPNGHLLTDTEIAQVAIEEERIIITKDRDFFDYYLLKGSPPRVVLLQFGNIENFELIRLFVANQDTLVALLNGGAELLLFSKKDITEYKG